MCEIIDSIITSLLSLNFNRSKAGFGIKISQTVIGFHPSGYHLCLYFIKKCA